MNTPQHVVLIVDDREENRYVLRHTLMRAGFQTIEAANGMEALAQSDLLPDVIVLDMRLPDILGYEVCRRLKANPRTKHIPVLQLSAAFLSTESKLYALESGADSYLIQPADPLVLVATVRSLVRLHEAERQAQAAAGQWAATFDALSEGVAIVYAGVVQRCNRAMTELLGLPYGQIEGQGFSELRRLHFGLGNAVALAEMPVETVQVGNRFYRLATASLPNKEAETGSIFIVADITPQKRAEEALLLNERLAATGRMAHIIAHEINNPLEAITNLLYLAERSDDFVDVRGFLNTAAGEVDRVARISRQILSFHREASEPTRIPIAELVEDVLALSVRSSMGKQLHVRMEMDRSLLVVGMPARLRQAFSNIIRNAMEASSAGGTLRVHSLRSFLRSGETHIPAVRITVADSGTGVPADLRSRIFEAFFTTKQQKGSGVGLWLTATIVQEHGGRLQVRSCTDAGRSGTCISLLLPAPRV